MREILLKNITRKRYIKLSESNASDHREDLWIERTSALLKLTIQESSYNYNSLIEIIALQTAYFMEKHVLEHEDSLDTKLTKKQPSLLKDLILYCKSPNTRCSLSTDEITYIFSFYMNFNNTWESFTYKSPEEKQEILKYRKLFMDTFKLWEMVRRTAGYENMFETDIKAFAVALYRKEYLPDAQIYIDKAEIPDDIVEACTSFKMNETIIIDHIYNMK